jgi:hypothetical protein
MAESKAEAGQMSRSHILEDFMDFIAAFQF